MKGWPGEQEMAYNQVVAQGAAQGASGKPITDVIFDFGKVLVQWDPEAVLRSRYSQEIIDRFLDNDVSGFYDASDQMDAGGTIKDAVAEVRARYGERWADMLDYYLRYFEDSLIGVMPGMRMLVQDLKEAGIGVWGLSNWSAELFPYAKKDYPILSELDDAVVSGYVKLRKPHRDIFEFALNRFGVEASTTLFVDDKGMNIVGANSAGIRGARFENAFDFRQLLIAQGVKVRDIER